MACTSCTRRYGFFCKEVGCPSCGYSFCGKCLKKEIEVPRCNNAKMKVCLRCFDKLEKEKHMKIEESPKTVTDVLTINEPVEQLAVPLEPIHLATEALPEDDDGDEDNEIADNLDNIISKKLNKLKDDGTPKMLPNDTDLAARLSNLKGVPHKEYSNKDILISKDTRTEKEKIDDLLKQFVDEKGIDDEAATDLDPIADIERRLALLKGDPLLKGATGQLAGTSKGPIIPDQKEDDDDVAIKKVLDQFLEESKLPGALMSEEEKELVSSLPTPSKNTEELPWCTICNEDATVRCLGCDGDLFCAQCFRECHDDEDFRQHAIQPFRKPPNFMENHF